MALLRARELKLKRPHANKNYRVVVLLRARELKRVGVGGYGGERRVALLRVRKLNLKHLTALCIIGSRTLVPSCLNNAKSMSPWQFLGQCLPHETLAAA